MADLNALQKPVAGLVKGRSFAARRVFVQYAPGTDRALFAPVIAALEQADAIIAWSQPLPPTP